MLILTCANCGGPLGIRNPTGRCDHLQFPDYLTPEAKHIVDLAKRLADVLHPMMFEWEQQDCRIQAEHRMRIEEAVQAFLTNFRHTGGDLL